MVSRRTRSPNGDRRMMALMVAGWATAVAVVIVLRDPAAAPIAMVPMVVTLHRAA